MVDYVRSLELSNTHLSPEGSSARSLVAIEEYLGQLDGDAQARLLARLLNGESLVAKYGEQAGRELAAYRLAILMESIGKAAHDLSDIYVFDVVIPGEDTNTDVELIRAGRI